MKLAVTASYVDFVLICTLTYKNITKVIVDISNNVLVTLAKCTWIIVSRITLQRHLITSLNPK